MSFAVPKIDKDTSSLAKLGGSFLSLLIWVGLVFAVVNYYMNNKTKEVKENNDIVVESFVPQAEDAKVKKELLDILKSVQKEMEECETKFTGENRIDCFNHYKTVYWQKTKVYLEQPQE